MAPAEGALHEAAQPGVLRRLAVEDRVGVQPVERLPHVVGVPRAEDPAQAAVAQHLVARGIPRGDPEPQAAVPGDRGGGAQRGEGAGRGRRRRRGRRGRAAPRRPTCRGPWREGRRPSGIRQTGGHDPDVRRPARRGRARGDGRVSAPAVWPPPTWCSTSARSIPPPTASCGCGSSSTASRSCGPSPSSATCTAAPRSCSRCATTGRSSSWPTGTTGCRRSPTSWASSSASSGCSAWRCPSGRSGPAPCSPSSTGCSTT